MTQVHDKYVLTYQFNLSFFASFSLLFCFYTVQLYCCASVQYFQMTQQCLPQEEGLKKEMNTELLLPHTHTGLATSYVLYIMMHWVHLCHFSTCTQCNAIEFLKSTQDCRQKGLCWCCHCWLPSVPNVTQSLLQMEELYFFNVCITPLECILTTSMSSPHFQCLDRTS